MIHPRIIEHARGKLNKTISKHVDIESTPYDIKIKIV